MKKLMIISLLLAICFSMVACSSISNDNSAESSGTQSSNQDAAHAQSPVNNTYQSVLADYTNKLEAATPILIEEYKREAAQNTGGLMGLAELNNAKIRKLADITVEGTSKMAEIMLYAGSGEMDEYQEWAGKLQDVYMIEAQKITDCYMESAK